MSLHALTWALYGDHGRDLDPAAKLMLVVMADHAGPEGLAWPSWQTLAQGAGVSRSTVARRVALLLDRGLIAPVPAEGCPASWATIREDRRPKAYRLALPTGYQAGTPSGPRGVRPGGTGSHHTPHGVSAVTPEPNNPNEHAPPCPHEEPRGARYCAICRRHRMRSVAS